MQLQKGKLRVDQQIVLANTLKQKIFNRLAIWAWIYWINTYLNSLGCCTRKIYNLKIDGNCGNVFKNYCFSLWRSWVWKILIKDLSRVKAGFYKRSSSTLFWIRWASQCQKVAGNSKYSWGGTLLKPAFTLLRSLVPCVSK